MANLQLPNDEILTIGILTLDEAGQTVPAPAGVAPITALRLAGLLDSTENTSPTGNPAVVINALVQASPGLSFTVSDKDGLTAFTEGVDIVQDTTPKAIGLDLANATSAPQPVPTSPGP